jgi:hypothetical protein
MSGRTSQGVFSRLFTIYAKRELSLVFFSATELRMMPHPTGR